MFKERLLQVVIAAVLYFGAFKAGMQIVQDKLIAVPAAVLIALGLHYILVKVAMDGRDRENFNIAFETAVLAICVAAASLWL